MSRYSPFCNMEQGNCNFVSECPLYSDCLYARPEVLSNRSMRRRITEKIVPELERKEIIR
jgi:hypothetical protein